MGTYKIRDLENLTGIKAHTIRIWEQRYGILKPMRSDTQIRSYDDEDVRLLLGVTMLNKHGLKISRIAEMSPSEIRGKVELLAAEEHTDVIEDQLLLALINLDEQLFSKYLTLLIDQHGLKVAYGEHLVAFLERIGVMWLVGTINPAQEHFISNLIRQKFISAIDRLPIPRSGKKVVLYLPEHEIHELSLLFYHYVLREQGYQTFYLGQSLPYDALLASLKVLEPDVLVSSWITSVDPEFLKKYFQNLRKATNVKIMAGGYQIQQNKAALADMLSMIGGLNDLLEL